MNLHYAKREVLCYKKTNLECSQHTVEQKGVAEIHKQKTDSGPHVLKVHVSRKRLDGETENGLRTANIKGVNSTKKVKGRAGRIGGHGAVCTSGITFRYV
jgi:hypothetical protein